MWSEISSFGAEFELAPTIIPKDILSPEIMFNMYTHAHVLILRTHALPHSDKAKSFKLKFKPISFLEYWLVSQQICMFRKFGKVFGVSVLILTHTHTYMIIPTAKQYTHSSWTLIKQIFVRFVSCCCVAAPSSTAVEHQQWRKKKSENFPMSWISSLLNWSNNKSKIFLW